MNPSRWCVWWDWWSSWVPSLITVSWEISNAINQVSDRIDPEANVLFGTVLDNSLGDMVEVTVIATGVEEEQSK